MVSLRSFFATVRGRTLAQALMAPVAAVAGVAAAATTGLLITMPSGGVMFL